MTRTIGAPMIERSKEGISPQIPKGVFAIEKRKIQIRG